MQFPIRNLYFFQSKTYFYGLHLHYLISKQTMLLKTY